MKKFDKEIWVKIKPETLIKLDRFASNCDGYPVSERIELLLLSEELKKKKKKPLSKLDGQKMYYLEICIEKDGHGNFSEKELKTIHDLTNELLQEEEWRADKVIRGELPKKDF